MRHGQADGRGSVEAWFRLAGPVGFQFSAYGASVPADAKCL
jgi:hypothetical protein